jgi:hypothetical protein
MMATTTIQMMCANLIFVFNFCCFLCICTTSFTVLLAMSGRTNSMKVST